MTLEEALARVRKLAERRREKAQSYVDAAAEFEARALSADEVLSSVQREFLVSLGMQAQRSAKAMAEDAEALSLVAGQWPEQAHEEYEKKQEALMKAGAP
jgi:hypothetical protein